MSQLNNTTKKSSCKHLNIAEREIIERMYRQNRSPAQIATALSRNKSTITRELKRGFYSFEKRNPYVSRNINVPQNIVVTEYSAELAQMRYDNSRANSGKQAMFVKCGEFLDYAVHQIKENKYSPDAIVGFAKKNKLFDTIPCTKTLYNIIDDGLLSVRNIDLTIKVKRKPHKKAHNRAHKRLYGKSIDERSSTVDDKIEFGHWEGDSVVGKNGKSSILTLVERSTGYYIILYTKGKTSAATIKALKRLKRRFGKSFKQIFKTITFDNGSEFADSMAMEKLGIQVYFAHPYSAWERGMNENANGILRRYLPKGMDLSKLRQTDLDRIAHKINSMPRRKRGYSCADDLFNQKVSDIINM